MRHRAVAVVACMMSIAACDSPAAPERCSGMVTEGELHVVIGPPYGLFGSGQIVFVDDTLHLTAEVRPAVGASIDFWGSGACSIDYGDPIPAVIEWSSSDTSIATVNATGVVSGRERGDAIITARAPARNIAGSREIGVWVRGVGLSGGRARLRPRHDAAGDAITGVPRRVGSVVIRASMDDDRRAVGVH